MPDVTVNLGDRSYRIHIDAGLLDSVGPLLRERCAARRATVITDHNVARHYSGRVVESLEGAGFSTGTITIAAGESSKSLATAARLYDGLTERGRGRHDPIVALGGGVVGDVAGFVAATWMRGVPLLQCPTSLEAMIDASVGGKTAVNHESGKNRIGAFYQPIGVAIDPACVGTLEDRDYRAALAESVKHALIADGDFFAWHESHADTIVAREPATMGELIAANCRIKARIVERDERESASTGVGRAALNFGHTIGHALEQASGYSLRHGEAVALGMMAALELSVRHCDLDVALRDRATALMTRFDLPVRTTLAESTEVLWELVLGDKKNLSTGVVRFVLLRAPGRPEWFEVGTADVFATGLLSLIGQ